MVAWLVMRSGWRGSFVILGALGFIWLALWRWKYREPEDCSWLSAGERDFILENRHRELSLRPSPPGSRWQYPAGAVPPANGMGNHPHAGMLHIFQLPLSGLASYLFGSGPVNEYGEGVILHGDPVLCGSGRRA